MQHNLILGSLILALLIPGLSACGKRGDPFRPSEVPEKNLTQATVR